MLLLKRLILPKLSSIKILPVPCLKDNYSYLVVDTATNFVAAVDPVEPEKIAACMDSVDGVKLKYILTTHHHWLSFFRLLVDCRDHSGGNLGMKKLYPQVEIVGFADRIPGLSFPVSHNQTFKVFLLLLYFIINI